MLRVQVAEQNTKKPLGRGTYFWWPTCNLHGIRRATFSRNGVLPGFGKLDISKYSNFIEFHKQIFEFHWFSLKFIDFLCFWGPTRNWNGGPFRPWRPSGRPSRNSDPFYGGLRGMEKHMDFIFAELCGMQKHMVFIKAHLRCASNWFQRLYDYYYALGLLSSPAYQTDDVSVL